MRRGIFTVSAGLLVGCGPSVEGAWTGQCLTQPSAARVQIDLTENSDDTWLASALLHRADRPGEALRLSCTDLLVDRRSLSVAGCRGSWDGEPTAVDQDFVMDGMVEGNTPVDVISGECGLDGSSGALDLWRTR